MKTIEINDLSTEQTQQLLKQAEIFRWENRNGNSPISTVKAGVAWSGDAACDSAQGGAQTNRAYTGPGEVSLENVDEVMRYQPWTPDQVDAGDVVRETLIAAVRAILRHVPRCPNRTKAINHLIDARMDANAAISFRGRF